MRCPEYETFTMVYRLLLPRIINKSLDLNGKIISDDVVLATKKHHKQLTICILNQLKLDSIILPQTS
jgi:hypothetical protein